MIPNLTLRQWRCVREMRQDEAAEKLGVSVTTISNWENGKNYPSMKTIQKIMEVYHIENINDIRFLCDESSVKPNKEVGV